MILKSSRIHTRGRGEAETLAHLLHGEENESVRVLRGTPADVRDAFADATRHARVYAVRHFIIAPAQDASPAEMLSVLDRLGREFGFDPGTAFVVEHRKPRAVAAFPGHLHALVPEVDPESGRVLASAHSFARQERVAREAEHALGHAFVKGAHHKAVLAALRAAGKAVVADALDRAFPDAEATPRPRSAYTDARHRRSARAGVDLPVAQQAVAAAWKATTTRTAFEAALARHGLVSRPGEAPGVWVVETGRGTFVGSLARLARIRKAAVITRMENPHERPVPVPAVRPAEQAPGAHHRAGDLPQHQADPRDPGAPRGPGGEDRGHGHGGGVGRDAAGDPERAAGGPGAAAGGAGGPTRPAGHPNPGGGVAGRRTGLRGPRPTLAALRLFLSLDRPDRIHFLHDAKGWANSGAKADLDRARDELVGMREAAELAQVLLRTATLPEPADLTEARGADLTAVVAARAARTEAAAASAARRTHAAGTPSGWRRLVGWASGANARHRAAEADLAATEAVRARAVDEAEAQARRVATTLRQAIERHEAAVRACREGYRAEAMAAPARIASVEAALDLLYQRPELARMGPAGLLRMGHTITAARNRATVDPEAEAHVSATPR